MGVGKTACAVGAVQLNRPPENWRKNRSYQTLRARDHLCECSREQTLFSVICLARQPAATCLHGKTQSSCMTSATV